MSAVDVILLAVAAALFFYLGAAMFKAEWF